MAVTVVPDDDEKRQVVCTGCLSMLEYTLADTKVRRTNEGSAFRLIACPECDTDITVGHRG
jgi:hypothetical protein